MAINLSKLNISLDKFNKEASGVMNIGQIKLSSDGKSVYRTNNHETLTILNRTKISSEEALAVKFAFCKALAKEGLSQEAINAVKQKLGIPGDAMAALKAGNIKPLTAAEVREVIDEYAGEINKNRASAANGAKALKTSKELYRGVGMDVMAARATTRNEINAKSISKLMTGTDKAVNSLLDMLQLCEKGGTVSADNKKRADPRDKFDEDIKNNVLDLDETLNINAMLGVDDEIDGEAQIEGFNQNAKKVRDAHAQMAKKVDEKTGTTTTERRNANILGMVNRSICDECKKMAAGDWENVTFFNDVSRQLNVTLPTGEKLSGEFEKARDQLSALVAKGAKYSDLDSAKKAKVHVLMAILNQRPGQGLLFSEGLTLDPDGNDSKLFFGGAKGKGGIEYSYMLSFAKDGSLDITCRAQQKGFEMLMLFGGAKDGVGSVTVMPGKESKVEATMELKIAPAEFDRLAGIDFSKYDADGVKAKYEDPNVQNRYSDRTLLGEDFMLDDANVTCTSTYKMTVN